MLDRLADGRSVTLLLRVAVAVLVAGFVACAAEGGSAPADPQLLAPGETQGPVTSGPPEELARTPLPGFGEVVIEVTKVDGQVVSWCVLLAATPEQRQRGLMEVADPELGGYDGMLFRFDAPTTGEFWMRNTPQPLSIAYIGDDGGLVSTAEMAPCEDSDACRGYPAAGPYRWAVEVPVAAGGVAGLGLEPGSRLVDTGRACVA